MKKLTLGTTFRKIMIRIKYMGLLSCLLFAPLNAAGNAFAAKVAPLVTAIKTHKWKCAGLALGAASVYASYHEASKTPEGQKKIKDFKRKASYISKTGVVATGLMSYGAYRGTKKLYTALGTVKPEVTEIVAKFFAGYVAVLGTMLLTIDASAKAATIEKSLAAVPAGMNLAAIDGLAHYPEFTKYAQALKAYATAPKGQVPSLLLYDNKGGTGKTYMIESLAGELKVPLMRADAATLKGEYLGQTEANIRREFAAAVLVAQSSPQRTVILCLDNIDSVGEKRATTGHTHLSDRFYSPVESIMAEMEKLQKNTSGYTVIICATSKNYQRLDAALKDKISYTIKLHNPDRATREAVLTRLLKLDKALLTWIAERTQEESMTSLSQLAGMINNLPENERTEQQVQAVVNIYTGKHYHAAVSSSVTQMDVVGGLPVEFQELLDKIKHPEKYKKLRKDGTLSLPSGFILYGPPGTGKTYTAKALAGSAGVPFFNVVASEVKQAFSGETDKAWRDTFDRAERAAVAHPSGMAILFIDEIDALGAHRGLNPLDTSVNALLTQIDGFSERRGHVIVIGATNKLEMIDPALKRPGRLTCHIEVSAPSQETHKKLFAHYLDQLKGEVTDKDAVLQQMAEIAHQHHATPVTCREIIKEAESQTGKAGLDVVTPEILMTALHKVLKIPADAVPVKTVPVKAVPAKAVPAKKAKQKPAAAVIRP